MNGLKLLFFWVANQIGLAFLWIDEHAREAYRDTRDSLIRYAMFTASFVIVAAIIGNVSYWNKSESGEYVAFWLFSVNYALGAVILGLTIIRALPLIIGAKVATSFFSNFASAASSKGRFSGAVSAVDQTYIAASRIWWSVIVSLQAFALVMTVFPLYRSIPGFLICLGSALGIAYAVGAREIGGVWYERYMTGVLFLFVLALLVTLINSILPGELNSRITGTWTAFTATEESAKVNNWVAILWFVAVVSSLFSGILLAWRISQGKRSLPLRWFGFSVALLLFMIFLGPRMIAAGQETAKSTLEDVSSLGNRLVSSNSTQKTATRSGGSVCGPYWINKGNNLETGKAYKFADDCTVYVYQSDGKLHKVETPEAFARHFNCPTNVTPLECRGIYQMPTSITKEDKILNGSSIN